MQAGLKKDDVIISIDGNKLLYKSYTALGELFDKFELIKNDNGLNSIVQ